MHLQLKNIAVSYSTKNKIKISSSTHSCTTTGTSCRPTTNLQTELENYGRPTQALIINYARPTTMNKLEPSTSFVDNTIDLPWQSFISPEFGTKFQREVPLFWRYRNFLIAQCRLKGSPTQKQLDSSSHYYTTPDLSQDSLLQTIEYRLTRHYGSQQA